jgi:division protein CdvB (Snf7/Vps24/ESCRT-III family)
MTIEERLDRIEHITAGIDEERRKDRDEYKALWRDTQRQLNELGARVVQMSEENQIAHAQFREADKRLEAHISQLAEEAKGTNKGIEDMVSGIGELIRHLPKQ